MAQTALGVLTVDTTGLLDADWLGVASTTGLSGLLAVLTAIVASGTGSHTNASFVPPLIDDVPGKHAADKN